MTLYPIILFVHGVAVLLLTATLTMESLLLWRLRRTPRPAEVRIWMDAVPAIAIAGVSALVTIYGTGGYLTKSLGASGFAWSRFAIVDVLIFALLSIFTGLRVHALRSFVHQGKSDPSEWRVLTRGSFLKLSLSVRICIVLGTMLLTAAKPALFPCVAIVGIALTLGALFSLLSFGRYPVISTENLR
jgi:hypothetical protein